jgi:hypothetical protein
MASIDICYAVAAYNSVSEKRFSLDMAQTFKLCSVLVLTRELADTGDSTA